MVRLVRWGARGREGEEAWEEGRREEERLRLALRKETTARKALMMYLEWAGGVGLAPGALAAGGRGREGGVEGVQGRKREEGEGEEEKKETKKEEAEEEEKAVSPVAVVQAWQEKILSLEETLRNEREAHVRTWREKEEIERIGTVWWDGDEDGGGGACQGEASLVAAFWALFSRQNAPFPPREHGRENLGSLPDHMGRWWEEWEAARRDVAGRLAVLEATSAAVSAERHRWEGEGGRAGEEAGQGRSRLVLWLWMGVMVMGLMGPVGRAVVWVLGEAPRWKGYPDMVIM
jgi:hypothetical protein